MTNQKAREWSGAVFDMTVLMVDGTEIEIRNTVGDVVRWEKNRKAKWGGGPIGMDGLLYLAWLVGRRTDAITERHYDNWVTQVADIDAQPVTRPGEDTTDLADENGPRWATPTTPGQPDDGSQS